MTRPVENPTRAVRTTWEGVFRNLTPRTLEDGEALVTPGEKVSRLFYLESGRLRCSVVSEGGCSKTLLYCWPGDICGETHLFEPERRIPLQVTSVGRSTVRSLGHAEARRIMVMTPCLAEDLMSSMAAKTLSMIEHIRQLRFLSLEARVASFLHMMYFARREDAGSRDLRLTHDEIADYVGAHRVSVTEALKRIEKCGAIGTGRGRIQVRDPLKLAKIMAG